MENGCVVSQSIGEQVHCVGRIFVDGQQDPNSDTMQKRVGLTTMDDLGFFSRKPNDEIHHNIFGIKKARKPKSSIGMKKKIVTAAVAIAVSIVTAVTSLGFSNIFKKNKDMVIIDESSSISTTTEVKENLNNDITSNKKTTNTKTDNSVLSVNLDTQKANLSESKLSNDESKREVVSSNIKAGTSTSGKKEKEEQDILKEKIVSLGDKITIKEGSSIYVSSDNANQQINGLEPIFSYSQERDVDMIVFDNNGTLIYADEKEEYDYCLKQNYELSCVRTGDGYYNGNDIIIINDEESPKVKVRVS